MSVKDGDELVLGPPEQFAPLGPARAAMQVFTPLIKDTGAVSFSADSDKFPVSNFIYRSAAAAFEGWPKAGEEALSMPYVLDIDGSVAGGAPVAPAMPAPAGFAPDKQAEAEAICSIRLKAIARIGKKLGVPFGYCRSFVPLPGDEPFDKADYRGGIVLVSSPGPFCPAAWVRSRAQSAVGVPDVKRFYRLMRVATENRQVNPSFRTLWGGNGGARDVPGSDGKNIGTTLVHLEGTAPFPHQVAALVPPLLEVVAAGSSGCVDGGWTDYSLWGAQGFPPRHGELGLLMTPLCLSEDVVFEPFRCTVGCLACSGNDPPHVSVVEAVRENWAAIARILFGALSTRFKWTSDVSVLKQDDGERALWAVYTDALARRRRQVEIAASRLTEVDGEIKALRLRRADLKSRHQRVREDLATAPKAPKDFAKVLRSSRAYHLGEIAREGFLSKVTWRKEGADTLEAVSGVVMLPLDDKEVAHLSASASGLPLPPEFAEVFALAGGKVSLGPFTVSVDASSLAVYVTPGASAPKVCKEGQDFFHPHLRPDAVLCWGNYGPLVEEARQNADPYALLWAASQVLQAYSAADGYVPLENFTVAGVRERFTRAVGKAFAEVRYGLTPSQAWARVKPTFAGRPMWGHERSTFASVRNTGFAAGVGLPFYRADVLGQPISYLVVLDRHPQPFLASDSTCLRWLSEVPAGWGVSFLDPAELGSSCFGLWCCTLSKTGDVGISARRSVGETVKSAVPLEVVAAPAASVVGASSTTSVSPSASLSVAPYAVGDWVFHHLYGEGRVRSVDGGVSVHFFGFRSGPVVKFPEHGGCLVGYKGADAPRFPLPCNSVKCLLPLDSTTLRALWRGSLWPEARGAEGALVLGDAVGNGPLERVHRYEPIPRRGEDGKLGDLDKYLRGNCVVYHHTWGFGQVRAASGERDRMVEVCFFDPYIKHGLHRGNVTPCNLPRVRTFIPSGRSRHTGDYPAGSCDARGCLVPVEGLALRSYVVAAVNTLLSGVGVASEDATTAIERGLFYPVWFEAQSRLSPLQYMGLAAGYPATSLVEWRG